MYNIAEHWGSRCFKNCELNVGRGSDQVLTYFISRLAFSFEPDINGSSGATPTRLYWVSRFCLVNEYPELLTHQHSVLNPDLATSLEKN